MYEPIIENYYPKQEGEISIIIGFIELTVIKLLSDLALSKTNLKTRPEITMTC